MSRLFLDTIQNALPSDLLYPTNLPQIAESVVRREFQRNALAEILTKQARSYGCDAASMESIDRLRDPRSVVAIAGQQAGWFGGPLLSLTKALAVAKAAKFWSAKFGFPVVPVFWIAADDHDLDEIRSATLLNRSGQLLRVQYPNDNSNCSAGESVLSDSDAVLACCTSFNEAIGTGEFTEWVARELSHSYTTGETYATSFAKLFARITADTGLVLFSPSDSELKRLALPFFEHLVTRQTELHGQFQYRTRMLMSKGYHAQVEKRSDAAFLFHHTPARQPISRTNESWTTDSRNWSTAELIDAIRKNPEQFSPDVISRPLLQSWLFPVIAQFGGPSEIAYLHQVAPLFETLSLTRPLHLARPGVTVIDRRSAELMENSRISFGRMVSEEPDSLLSSILSDSFPKEIQQELENIRADIRLQASRLSTVGLAVDQQTSDFATQTAGKIDYLVGQFAEKLQQAHRRKEKETRERWQKTLNLVAPNNGLQERTINTLALFAKFGPKLPELISECIDPDNPDHRLLII